MMTIQKVFDDHKALKQISTMISNKVFSDNGDYSEGIFITDLDDDLQGVKTNRHR